MAFSLRTVRDNDSKVFSIRKILELLGENINDEILIDGKAYRISSFLALDGGSGTGESSVWISTQLLVRENKQTIFTLSETINSLDEIQLFINGILYPYGLNESYHILSTLLYWHGGFDLELSDRVMLKYNQII